MLNAGMYQYEIASLLGIDKSKVSRILKGQAEVRDRKVYAQKYYQEHKEEYDARKKRYRREGRYEDHTKEYSLRYRKEHKEFLQQQREQARVEVLSYYSAAGYPTCACCGIIDVDILTIDHINDDGNKQRKELGWRGSGIPFYNYLKEHDYPPGYQVLCQNCNWKKRIQSIEGRGETSQVMSKQEANERAKAGAGKYD